MTLTASDRKRLRAEAQQLQPVVRVGKAGLAEATLDEVRRHLKANRLIKIRLLPSATEGGQEDANQAEALAQAVGAELVETRGHTAILYKPRA